MLIYGRLPFDKASNWVKLMQRLNEYQNDLSLEFHDNTNFGEDVINDNLVDLLRNMLTKDPDERISLRDIKVGCVWLRHHFVMAIT